jgi:hypothetical protein
MGQREDDGSTRAHYDRCFTQVAAETPPRCLVARRLGFFTVADEQDPPARVDPDDIGLGTRPKRGRRGDARECGEYPEAFDTLLVSGAWSRHQLSSAAREASSSSSIICRVVRSGAGSPRMSAWASAFASNLWYSVSSMVPRHSNATYSTSRCCPRR